MVRGYRSICWKNATNSSIRTILPQSIVCASPTSSVGIDTRELCYTFTFVNCWFTFTKPHVSAASRFMLNGKSYKWNNGDEHYVTARDLTRSRGLRRRVCFFFYILCYRLAMFEYTLWMGDCLALTRNSSNCNNEVCTTLMISCTAYTLRIAPKWLWS